MAQYAVGHQERKKPHCQPRCHSPRTAPRGQRLRRHRHSRLHPSRPPSRQGTDRRLSAPLSSSAENAIAGTKQRLVDPQVRNLRRSAPPVNSRLRFLLPHHRQHHRARMATVMQNRVRRLHDGGVRSCIFARIQIAIETREVAARQPPPGSCVLSETRCSLTTFRSCSGKQFRAQAAWPHWWTRGTLPAKCLL